MEVEDDFSLDDPQDPAVHRPERADADQPGARPGAGPDGDPDPRGAAADRPVELPGGPPPAFSYNDRLYALGISRAGKSEILNVLFSGLACQRVLIDSKPEFAIEGVAPVSDPERIDWTQQTIHYKPPPGSGCAQYEEVFRQASFRRGVTICAHELAALVEFKPNKAGPFLRTWVSQGGALGQGALFGSQRPFLIPSGALTEANHVLMIGPQLAKADDNRAAAEAFSPVGDETFTADDLVNELAIIRRELGPYAFLWKDRFSGVLQANPPLSENIRRLSIVQRLEDA